MKNGRISDSVMVLYTLHAVCVVSGTRRHGGVKTFTTKRAGLRDGWFSDLCSKVSDESGSEPLKRMVMGGRSL